jgi:glycosyltransferase involved in cell wall biosynthesis
MVYVEAHTKPETLKEGTQERPLAMDMDGAAPPARPRVSVIIPALNEAANIPHVIGQVPELVHEVVLVDGFSTDGTTEVAQRVWPNHHIVVKERRRGTERRTTARDVWSDRSGGGRALRVVQQTRRGKENALHSGIAAATGEIIVMMDANGSTDPQEIGRFVDTLVRGADFAKGSRFLRDGRVADRRLSPGGGDGPGDLPRGTARPGTGTGVP